MPPLVDTDIHLVTVEGDSKQDKLSAVVYETFVSALSAGSMHDFKIAYSRFWRDLYAFKDSLYQRTDEDPQEFEYSEFKYFRTECIRLKEQSDFWQKISLDGGDGHPKDDSKDESCNNGEDKDDQDEICMFQGEPSDDEQHGGWTGWMPMEE